MSKKFRAAICLVVASFLVITVLGYKHINQNISNAPQDQIQFQADYEVYNDLETMIKNANLVVLGEVIKVNEPKKMPFIDIPGKGPVYGVYTVSEIQVKKVIKGNVNPGDIVQVKQLGGNLGTETWVENESQLLSTGEKGVFFLDETSPASLLNPSQGFVKIVDNKIKPHKNNNLIKSGLTEDAFLKILTEKGAK